jgi:hypothetical protein
LTSLCARLQNGGQPVKRKRALLASNPPRNSRSEADLNDPEAASGRPSSWGLRTASPCLKNAPWELDKIVALGHASEVRVEASPPIAILYIFTYLIYLFSSVSSLRLTRWAGRVGSPPPAGDEARPRGRWILARRARVFRVGSVPFISAGSPGCSGPDEVVREQVPIRLRS